MKSGWGRGSVWKKNAFLATYKLSIVERSQLLDEPAFKTPFNSC
jgi:hypothetical protein